VALESASGEIASAYNAAALEAAGLSRADLVRFRERRPLPLERILGGEVYVRNSTLSGALQTFTLATAQPGAAGQAGRVVSAEIRLDALQRPAARAEGFEVYVADSDGVYLAHPQQLHVAEHRKASTSDRALQLENLSSAAALEYVDEGEEVIGGFASAHYAGVTVGAKIPRSAAYLASGALTRRLMVVALMLLLGATAVGLISAERLTRPLTRLASATREIAQGRFDVKVESTSRDEIGALAQSFNQMGSELLERDEALAKTQAQLVQSEKLAAFGQLGAGIAHEVKNPLAGILGCAQLTLRKVEEGSLAEKNLRLIEKETRRCKAIIENLLRFARQEKALLEPIEVNPVIHDACAIVEHQLGMHQVRLVQEPAQGLPRVHGNANQLQQVLMNLVMNAQQAMEGRPGKVTVRSGLDRSGRVELSVRDDGPGMPPEVQARLFEPFFTTKPGGKGTGLGLSVSFGIVKDHGGDIEVESAVGKGTTFYVRLPALGASVAQPYATAQGA
jgi:signal transduction histidine kinase